MRRIEAKYDDAALKEFLKLQKSFPDLRAQVLGLVGSEGKRRLKERLLSGQEINLRKYPYDKMGRRTAQYTIGKGAQHVSISSYPVNLFEKGRKLRSGNKEPGKFILTKKLKNIMAADLQGILQEADKKILQEMLNKL
jgi:hypothetical protein